jgi:hypothetical protein
MGRLARAAITGLLASGAVSQSPIIWYAPGTVSYTLLGYWGVVGVGDVDGDFREDVIASSTLERSVFAYSGATGQIVWTATDPEPFSQFGRSINSGGDVDGDGVRDIVVGAKDHKDTQGATIGGVYVLSGAGGTVIRLHEGSAASPIPGYAGPIIGDADADGYDDYMLFGSTNPLVGAVSLRSGRTGAVLYSWSSVLDASGWACPIGDVDGDGFDDVLLNEAGCTTSISLCKGAVACYSGKTGTLMYRVYGDSTAPQDFIGMAGATCAGEDLSGDGVPDFVVSADTAVNGWGMVRAYSGVDGAVLWTRFGNASHDALGRHLSVGDDWNGDGHADVIAVEYLFPQAVDILSGTDGSTLAMLVSPSPAMGFGDALSLGGDLDGDGMREILTAGNVLGGPLTNPGAIFVLQAATGPSAYRLHHGRPCPGSNGHLPRIRIPVDPRLGSVADVRLRGALPQTWSLLAVGLPTSLDLNGIGATNCTLMVDPVWLSGPVILDADGMGRHPVPIPPDSGLQGLVLQAQWVVGDAAANGLGLTFSDAARVMVGW